MALMDRGLIAGKRSRVLFDDRVILMASLALAAAVSWVYLIHMAVAASPMPPDSGFRAGAVFIMWVIMMIGMMIPTAMPGIQAIATAERRRWGSLSRIPYVVALGYVTAWAVFAALATGGQWLLHEFALLSATQSLNSSVLAGGVLVAAGVFQITPMKGACLRYCRSPLGILVQGVPQSSGAALTTGLQLGAYCVGCCWALMLLMFVGGVMNVFWMALLTVVMLLEKVLARGRQLGYLLGVGLAVYGVWLVGLGLA